MGGGGRLAPFRDQRAELRSLQNLRHQRSEPEHHLGSSRGRGWAELSEYVKGSARDGRLGTRDPSEPDREHPNTLRRVSCVTMLPLSRLKAGGHARSGQLLQAGPKPSILPNAAAPKAFVRQMESTSRDPFAFFAACGRGRNGCTRHIVARDALRSGAATA